MSTMNKTGLAREGKEGARRGAPTWLGFGFEAGRLCQMWHHQELAKESRLTKIKVLQGRFRFKTKQNTPHSGTQTWCEGLQRTSTSLTFLCPEYSFSVSSADPFLNAVAATAGSQDFLFLPTAFPSSSPPQMNPSTYSFFIVVNKIHITF